MCVSLVILSYQSFSSAVSFHWPFSLGYDVFQSSAAYILTFLVKIRTLFKNFVCIILFQEPPVFKLGTLKREKSAAMFNPKYISKSNYNETGSFELTGTAVSNEYPLYYFIFLESRARTENYYIIVSKYIYVCVCDIVKIM